MNGSPEIVYIDYRGVVLYETIGNLIIKLKENMFEHKVRQSTFKKVLMIMIEALENTFKYGDHYQNETELIEDYSPRIKIFSKDGTYQIECANPIQKIDVPILKRKLEHINSLDKQGLKEEYKRIITNGQFSEKGGAGLGIIEMAKISDGALNYSFEPINERFEFYVLQIRIFCS